MQAPSDARQQVVEIVREPARKLSHRLHLVRLAQGLLRHSEFGLRFLFSRDVAAYGMEKPLVRHRIPGQPAIPSVPASTAALEFRCYLARGEPADLSRG